MSKPLRDWTIGELKKYCASKNERCDGCLFVDGFYCILQDNAPMNWDIPYSEEGKNENRNANL